MIIYEHAVRFLEIAILRVLLSLFIVTIPCHVFANTWTWIKGSSSPNRTGLYGTQGISANINTPGARHGSVSWTDSAGTLWLFGGSTSEQSATDPLQGIYYNDLWKFVPQSGNWCWVKGSNGSNQFGIYGTQGIGAPGNTPGARYSSTTWKDVAGNLWLFGGYGYSASGVGVLNDLWKFEPSNGSWTWVHGDYTAEQRPVYGEQGIAAPENCPGARISSASWLDSQGNIWLFGGMYGTLQRPQRLNDLWMFDPNSGNWKWVKGSTLINENGIYGA